MRLDRSHEHGVERAVELGETQTVDEGTLAPQQRAVLASVSPRGVRAHSANLSHRRSAQFQSLAEAIRAPSASAANFGHTTVGCTSGA